MIIVQKEKALLSLDWSLNNMANYNLSTNRIVHQRRNSKQLLKRRT